MATRGLVKGSKTALKAGKKAAKTRKANATAKETKLSNAGKKAAATKKENKLKAKRSEAGKKAAATRRANRAA